MARSLRTEDSDVGAEPRGRCRWPVAPRSSLRGRCANGGCLRARCTTRGSLPLHWHCPTQCVVRRVRGASFYTAESNRRPEARADSPSAMPVCRHLFLLRPRSAEPRALMALPLPAPFTARCGIRSRPRAVHTLCSGPVRQFKKCRFQAHVAAIAVEADIADALAAVVASDKKVSKATHSAIAAWRLEPGPGGAEEVSGGYDDCGESGAGKRLLQLLEARGDTNTLVAVTRWYGGKPLGGARFRQITNAASDLLAEQSDRRAG